MRVAGRVQGVGFRWFTQRQAKKHGVTGWVRNRTDGTVELEAWGSEEELSRFRSAVRSGPAISSVSNLEESPVDGGSEDQAPLSFEILPTD